MAGAIDLDAAARQAARMSSGPPRLMVNLRQPDGTEVKVPIEVATLKLLESIDGHLAAIHLQLEGMWVDMNQGRVGE